MSQEETLDGLWRLHAGAVWAYAARRTGRQEADDVVAQTFTVAVRRWDGRSVRQPRAWLLGIAANVLRDQSRTARRAGALQDRLRSLPQPGHQDCAPVLADEALGAALAGLSATNRELLLLVAWDGLPVGQAGAVLGLGPGAARMRFLRVRQELRRAYRTPEPLPASEHTP